MIYAVGFLTAVLVGLLIYWLSIRLDEKPVMNLEKKKEIFVEWLKEIYKDQGYTLVFAGNKATTSSYGVKIKYDFQTGKGVFKDTALDMTYDIIFKDNEFYFLQK